MIQMDVLRKESLAIPAEEHRLDNFGQGIYSEDMTRLVYEKALEKAAEALKAGRSAIIDASFKRKEHRLAARDLAVNLNVDFRVLECFCPDRCALDRLKLRMNNEGEASDGRPEIYGAQKKDFDVLDEFPPSEHLKLDTSGPVQDIVSVALAYLKGLKILQ